MGDGNPTACFPYLLQFCVVVYKAISSLTLSGQTVLFFWAMNLLISSLALALSIIIVVIIITKKKNEKNINIYNYITKHTHIYIIKAILPNRCGKWFIPNLSLTVANHIFLFFFFVHIQFSHLSPLYMFGYLAFAAFGTFRVFENSNALKNIVRLIAIYCKYNLFNSQSRLNELQT